MKLNTALAFIAALFMATGVALGAFGAHAMENVLSADQLATWDTATKYLFINALGALLLALVGGNGPSRTLNIASLLLLIGVLLFSGSLYLLCIVSGWRWLGPVTPVGGAALIAGWITAAFGLLKYLSK